MTNSSPDIEYCGISQGLNGQTAALSWECERGRLTSDVQGGHPHLQEPARRHVTWRTGAFQVQGASPEREAINGCGASQ